MFFWKSFAVCLGYHIANDKTKTKMYIFMDVPIGRVNEFNGLSYIEMMK